MIFIDFLKTREEKNKYGMLAQNFNRRTNVAMEHNGQVFTNTGLKIPKLSTETEREKWQTSDLMTSTPCLQILCCRKCGKGQ